MDATAPSASPPRRSARSWVIRMLLGVALLLGVEGLWAVRDNGVPYQHPTREAEAIGKHRRFAPPLRYAVLGDSTVAGQGAPYSQGIARKTAAHLAKRRPVLLRNFGFPGSTTADVWRRQLGPAIEFGPDVVLVSVGANDATHLARPSAVAEDLRLIIDGLRDHQCEVKIVITGVADLSSTPRLLWPLGELLDLHGGRVHRAMVDVAESRQVGIAPIAKETGPRFSADPDLFAADGFHPNAAGYQLWVNTINRALDQAPQRQCAVAHTIA